ncbi:hypothetical protein R5R35_008997 [Gryllus longicercus]|uniref:HMG box domain-containing protein n=1 Tax=Gryllus longicercus TaxID=2509291 RepID=A0AAN9V9E5_9ORTH
MEHSSTSSVVSLKQESMEVTETSVTTSSVVTAETNQPDSTENSAPVSSPPDQENSMSTTAVINGGEIPKSEKLADVSDTGEPKLNKPKSKKKKKLDPSAPRQPLSGYMRYLNDRREIVRGENPSLSFIDITKLLAEEWNHLPQDKKQPYVEAGQQDRERYTRELNAYKKTQANLTPVEKPAEKKARKSQNMGENGVLSDNQDFAENGKKENDCDGDIHIFTDEFLDLNRACESEFRQLRAQNTEFEEQNALLEKHNETMKSAIERMEKANMLLRSNTCAVEEHLNNLRNKFVEAFQIVSVPGKRKPATHDNVDEYIEHVEKSVEFDEISMQLREYIQKLDFEV